MLRFCVRPVALCNGQRDLALTNRQAFKQTSGIHTNDSPHARASPDLFMLWTHGHAETSGC